MNNEIWQTIIGKDSFQIFIQNEWTVGIIGGVISGFIVYWLTEWWVSRKENKVYRKNIQSANLEILVILRPLIAEKSVIKSKILSSMISAIARKWEVKVTELYTFEELGEELVREVMASNFIDSDTKQLYTQSIEDGFFKTEPNSVEKLQKSEVNNESKSILSAPIAMAMGITTAIMSMTMTVLINHDMKEVIDKKDVFDKLVNSLIAPITISFVSIMVMFFLSEYKSARRKIVFKQGNELGKGIDETRTHTIINVIKKNW